MIKKLSKEELETKSDVIKAIHQEINLKEKKSEPWGEKEYQILLKIVKNHKLPIK